MPGAAENDAAGREIRPRHDADQIVDREPGIVDQRHAGVDHFAEIVRRDVGRHADRDAARAVDQQIGKARRQDHRLVLVAVVVLLEVDGVFVDVLEQRHRRLGQAAFGVAHRRGRIAVDRAEIALPVDQRQAHREVLRHAHQRVIDRLVAVRVIFAHHVADDARRFHVLLVGRVALLVHRIEDAAVDRLQAVAHVGERTRHDHAHRVIEIRALHLVRDGHGRMSEGEVGSPGLSFSLSAKGNSGKQFRVAIHIGDLVGDGHRKAHRFPVIISLCFFSILRSVRDGHGTRGRSPRPLRHATWRSGSGTRPS